MNIDELRRKKQLNVQQQNTLARDSIARFAKGFRRGDEATAWVCDVLRQQSLDPALGVLAHASAIPCGGDEESAHALWVTPDGRVFRFEATLKRGLHLLVSVDEVKDVTAELGARLQRGRGKSLGLLALEVLGEGLDA